MSEASRTIRALVAGLGLTFFAPGVSASVAFGETITIHPSDDGSIYSTGAVITFAYLLPAGDIRGVAEFPTSTITAPILHATLSVNPYGLPLSDTPIAVYGYESQDGRLSFLDYDAGVFLGNWSLPKLDFGQDAFFDVTRFLQSVSTPYVGFNLRSSGVFVFSSLEYNYGHPAELTVTTVPEPASWTLAVVAICFANLLRRRLSFGMS